MLPDIGGVEFIIVAVVALMVFKPKDLPMVMRKFGQFIGNAKRLAADFRASFDDMARQSELDDLRKEVEAMRSKAVKVASNPVEGLAETMTDTEREISSGLAGTTDPDFDYGASPTPEPAAAEPPAETPPSDASQPIQPRKAAKPAGGRNAAARKPPKPKAAADKGAKAPRSKAAAKGAD